MNHQALDISKQKEVAELFTSVFTASEGEDEGKLIGDLAAQLASNIDDRDIICLGTYDNETLVGCIFFTRLQFKDASPVFMLAPVAVRTGYQGKGIGQALINYGLDELRKRRVSVVVTYGDPSFYSKTGFMKLPEKVIQAPMKLSMPPGWLGQSLTGNPIPTIQGRPVCVEAFNNPVYW